MFLRSCHIIVVSTGTGDRDPGVPTSPVLNTDHSSENNAKEKMRLEKKGAKRKGISTNDDLYI